MKRKKCPPIIQLSLNALVVEASEVSDQSDKRVADAEAIQHTIAASTERLLSATREGLFEDQESGNHNMSLDMLMEDISRKSRQFRENASEIFEMVETLQKSIDEATAALDFIIDLEADMKDYLRQLEDAGRSMGLEQDDGKALSNEGSDLVSHRYTMREERDIHRQFIEKKAMGDDENDEMGIMEVSDNEYGDNVELF